ncbi:TetR/AcrR family transcriptional regulator [Leptospira stimsonii]|uniref:TetR/AcrR family transcriptional regulator n=1 Tax=Leptospira stimsonii TaxID=2202203 RepID=A0ABY2NEV2_9LEPT|nr:TetR/AcrR family transcriptional regulator [Leptospira stimsonii]TGK25979.1 TetR/AcrR family transcriptional regulator [Leptospira stimsonii]TGM22412.1 TetR/AcrR family transcriptional regulator [Leptospira stimsonii]
MKTIRKTKKIIAKKKVRTGSDSSAVAKSLKAPAAKRLRLLQSAIKLVYQQGFDKTTLADIATESKVPLGNVYYYFKTKDAIGDALIEQHVQDNRAIRNEWDKDPDPKNRLISFIQMMQDNSEQLSMSGCPMGTLCSELQKQGGPLAQKGSQLFSEFLVWIETQFRGIGQGAESRNLAVHLLSVLEGATLLTHSFRDPAYLVREANWLREWVRTMSPQTRKISKG